MNKLLMPLLRIFAFATSLAALSFIQASAQVPGASFSGGAQAKVSWQIEPTRSAAHPGEQIGIRFLLQIEDGWHLYALDSPAGRPLAVRFDGLPEGFSVKKIRQSEPSEGFDPNFQENVRYFEEKATVEADIGIAGSVLPGAYTLEGKITHMVCNDRICLPPRTDPFSVNLSVSAGEVRSAFASSGPPGESGPAETESGDPSTDDPEFGDSSGIQDAFPPAAALTQRDSSDLGSAASSPGEALPGNGPDSRSEMNEARTGGLWGFLLLALGAGLAALLTPCVFPMIPLTVSYFTKHSGSRSEAARMAAIYGLAIVLTFTGLGVLMAALVGASGAQSIAANPWINLFIGVVFVVFALSLLGLFELRLPSGLLNYFNRKSNEQGGYVGVLFMGLTLTLVSFSCTAPFVGGLLAATAGGEWTYPVLGMLVFSATFAMPFVLFALFPRGLSSLPRSGVWMNSVKVVLGFVELAAAIKFLSNADLVWNWNLITRPLAIALVTVIFFLAGLYLLGKLPLKHEPPVEHIGVGRLLSAVAFFGLSLYLLPGLLGAPLGAIDAYLPPRQATDVGLLTGLMQTHTSTASHDESGWHVDSIEAALAEAQSTGKPVLVDFTGYTCTNCRQMEANIFPVPEVNDRFARNFVLLRLYTDGLERGDEYQRYQLKLTGTVALPTYAIMTPDEKLISKWSGVASVSEFTAFLDEGVTRFVETYEPDIDELAARN